MTPTPRLDIALTEDAMVPDPYGDLGPPTDIPLSVFVHDALAARVRYRLDPDIDRLAIVLISRRQREQLDTDEDVAVWAATQLAERAGITDVQLPDGADPTGLIAAKLYELLNPELASMLEDAKRPRRDYAELRDALHAELDLFMYRNRLDGSPVLTEPDGRTEEDRRINHRLMSSRSCAELTTAITNLDRLARVTAPLPIPPVDLDRVRGVAWNASQELGISAGQGDGIAAAVVQAVAAELNVPIPA